MHGQALRRNVRHCIMREETQDRSFDLTHVNTPVSTRLMVSRTHRWACQNGGAVIHDVLVYANNFDKWSVAVEYAARLAASEQANLTAAYVYPTPAFMMPGYGASALLAAIVEQTRQIERESLAAEQRFVAWAREHLTAAGLAKTRRPWLCTAMASGENSTSWRKRSSLPFK